MSEVATPVQAFEQVIGNPVNLGLEVTVPVCEGLNVARATFQGLYLQYQKHHFVVEGTEFYQLHEFFQESYETVRSHIHNFSERLNGLGGIPASTFSKLAELCAFEPEVEGRFTAREMLQHDLVAEQAVIAVLRSQAAQAESLGDRATRYLYEQVLLATEDRAFHIDHFLSNDSLTLGLNSRVR
ncbi:MAG: ferritin-like domain-containing protein [Cyanobacteria bacterium J06642_2]